MTSINDSALEAAAIAFNQAELRGGIISLGDKLAAAITAYYEAADLINEFATSTAVLGIGDEQMKAVEDAIEQRVIGNDLLREKSKKFFDGILCEMLDGFAMHFASDTRWNLDRLIVGKAKLLVDAMLRGDEEVMKSFLGWSWNGKTRKAVLDAVVDYSAKAEVEELRHKVAELEKRLKWREPY